MATHVCPWWAVPFTIDPPFRRFLHDPQKIVGPYIKPGMTVLDVGCGVGYLSVPMARIVGDQGRGHRRRSPTANARHAAAAGRKVGRGQPD